MKRNMTKEKNSNCVILTMEEYDELKKEIIYYKKTIEELQDELDSIEADKIKRVSKGTKCFQLEDYVSNKDRTNSSKSVKKTTPIREGKSRKVNS